jgi:hypothetical protein
MAGRIRGRDSKWMSEVMVRRRNTSPQDERCELRLELEAPAPRRPVQERSTSAEASTSMACPGPEVGFEIRAGGELEAHCPWVDFQV